MTRNVGNLAIWKKVEEVFFCFLFGKKTYRIYMTGMENNDNSNKTSKMLNVDSYRFLIIHRDRSADSSNSRIGRDFGSLV